MYSTWKWLFILLLYDAGSLEFAQQSGYKQFDLEVKTLRRYKGHV